MKENNQYYSKNAEFIANILKSEGQITNKELDLYTSSQKGDFVSLSQLLNKVEFKSHILNNALFILVNNYKSNESYDKCLKLLFSTNFDLNYKYPHIENKTIFMIVLGKSELNLFKNFMECINTRINSIKILPTDKLEEYQISEIKNIFSQKDTHGNNFSHLFNTIDKVELLKIFWYLYYKFPYLGDKRADISKTIQRLFQNFFLEKNNDGNTCMSISLEKNFIKIVFKLLSINGYKPNVNNKNNNLVHSAVLSKNINCVKIILYYCSEEDLLMKNNDLLTPSQLANKIGFCTMAYIINEYQNNYKEKEYKEHYYKNFEIYNNKISNLKGDLLNNIIERKYKEIYFELTELKIIYEMSNDIANNNIDNILYKLGLFKIKWNIILCKYKLCTNINDLLTNKEERNDTNKLKNVFNLIYEFYFNDFTNDFILSLVESMKQLNQIQKENNNDDGNQNIIPFYSEFNQSLEILLYNKIIFYFKTGQYKLLLETAKIYLSNIFISDKKSEDINIANKKQFILFVNISCILTEILILNGFKAFAQMIINGLDKYLFLIHENDKFKIIEYSPYEITVFKYLNKMDVLHQYSAFFSEMFCYSNYLKLMNNDEKNKDKEYYSQIKQLLNNSKFAQDGTIFGRLELLYNYIEIKKIYQKDAGKIYTKLSELNYCDESVIYYLNTLGIAFLKRQKYNLSKLFFTKGYYIYKQIIKNKPEKLKKSYNFRSDIITAFLYNISLCYFNLKQYNKCIAILESILNFKNNRNNIFIHYRLGLSYYYLYIESSNKNSDYYNKNILKLIGYEKIKNYKKRENIKQLSIDLDNNGIITNLSQKLEAEHKKKINKEKHENKFSFHNTDKNEKMQQKYNNIYKSGRNLCGNSTHSTLKKIILKNSFKLISNRSTNYNATVSNNFLMNKKINNNKSEFLNKAIKAFKRVIFISRLNEYNNYSENMKNIYEFYSSYLDDEKNKSDSEKEIDISNVKTIPNELLINSYFNLLMCLSLKKNWLEMILTIKEFDNREIILPNKIIELKIWLYELEAYIHLKNNKKIKEIISKIKKFKKINLSLLNKINDDVINEINIKLYIYYTLTKIYIGEKNFKEVDSNIKKILFLIKDWKNIPYYIIDLLLNVYIIKLNCETNINNKTKYRYNNIILNLIKNKKSSEE